MQWEVTGSKLLPAGYYYPNKKYKKGEGGGGFKKVGKIWEVKHS